MRRLKRILHVAGNDLRIMVGDKIFFFWTLAFPVLFIVLFGLVFKAGDNAPPVAELDRGQPRPGTLGKLFHREDQGSRHRAEGGRRGAGRIQPPARPAGRFFGQDRGPPRPGPGLQEAFGRVGEGGRPGRDPALSDDRPGPQRARSLWRRRSGEVLRRPPGVPRHRPGREPVPGKDGHRRPERIRPHHPRHDHPVHHDDGHHLRRHHGDGGPEEGGPGTDALLAALDRAMSSRPSSWGGGRWGSSRP